MIVATAPAPAPDPLQIDLRAFLTACRVNPVRKMARWYEEEFIVPDGPFEYMPWKWSRQPVAKLWIDELDSGNWTECYLTGPSQSGKSLIGFVGPALYHAFELRENYTLGLPDMRMADNKWKVDLLPVIKANPRMAALLPDSGPGSQGGTVHDTITLKNNSIFKFMSAGGSDQQRAAWTSRVVGVTEAARFSRVSETSRESNPLRQLQARQNAWDEPDRQLYVEGTGTIEEDLPWSAHQFSSQSRIVSQCPHCGGWIAPEREHLLGFDVAESLREAQQRAVWGCPLCGETIDERLRRESVASSKLLHFGQTIDKRGNITGDLPPTNRLWFRYSAWHNLFTSTATLGGEEWRCNQLDPDSLEFEDADKDLTQFKWSRPYKHRNDRLHPLDAKELRKRIDARMPNGMLPTHTTHLAVGADIGKYAMHYVVMAGCDDGTLHIPSYGMINIPTNYMDWPLAIQTALDELFDMCELGWVRRPVAATTEPANPTGEDPAPVVVKPNQLWIDTGYEPNAIYAATIRRFKRIRKTSMVQLFLGRGSGQLERMYAAPPKVGGKVREIGNNWHVELNKRWRASQIYGNADHWKDRIHDGFKLQVDENGARKPGSISLYHAPEKEHNKFSKHLTNEHRTEEFEPGRGMVVKWDRRGQNHWFDGCYMARAALDRAGWTP